MRSIWWVIGGIGLTGVGMALALSHSPPDPAAVNSLLAVLAADGRIPAELRASATEVAYGALSRLPRGWLADAFARLLFAVLQRESRGGTALAADGTGDHVARVGHYLTDSGSVVLDALPQGWSPPKDRYGRIIPGPWAIPLDGRGWGRSKWQIDYGAHAFARGPDVDDPLKAADYAASVLADAVKYWTGRDGHGYDVATLAAASYNAGPGHVKAVMDAAVDRGEQPDPDAATTGGNYGGDVVADATNYGADFGAVA